jgi:hypothetical protein
MQYKTCSKCQIEKLVSEFHKRGDRFKSHCKLCRNSFEYLPNKEEHILRAKNSKRKNPEKYKLLDKACAERNKSKRNSEARLRRLSDPEYRITHNLRMRLNRAVKGTARADSTCDLLGCKIDFYIQYLESKFLPGMTFENYGKWHIDHIKPCASFDLSDPEQQRACFHYTNTQPLWMIDNLRKGSSS